MSFSAPDGTGRGNDEHRFHPNHPAIRASESLPNASVLSVKSINNGPQHLPMIDQYTPSIAHPPAVVRKLDENSSKNLTDSEDEQSLVELDNDLNQQTKDSPPRLAILCDRALPRHGQDWLPNDERDHENYRDDNENKKVEESPYSSAISFSTDDSDDDDAQVESDGMHKVCETDNDINDETKEEKNQNNNNDKSTPAKEGLLQIPDSHGIESASDNGFSEDEDTPLSKYLGNIAILMKNGENGEIHAVNTTVDTGATTSGISRETVLFYGLKERPLKEPEIKTFTGLVGDESCTPETFVIVMVKCKKLGIDEWIKAKIRVLNSTGFEIVFGIPFIDKHNILAKLPKFDGSGKPFFVMKGERSKAQIAHDRAIRERHREIALALERQKGAGSSSTNPPTRSSTGSDSTRSTTSWDDASVSWDSKPPTRSSTGSDCTRSTTSWDDASVSWDSKPPTRSSTGSDCTRSTTSWDDASVSWDSKKSSNTSWATTTIPKNSGVVKSLRKD